ERTEREAEEEVGAGGERGGRRGEVADELEVQRKAASERDDREGGEEIHREVEGGDRGERERGSEGVCRDGLSAERAEAGGVGRSSGRRESRDRGYLHAVANAGRDAVPQFVLTGVGSVRDPDESWDRGRTGCGRAGEGVAGSSGQARGVEEPV